MSGVLRLDQTARLFHGGAEMAEAWLGGIRVWQGDPLVQYYGVGPGQVPMDLRLDAAAKTTLTNGRVTGVANDGGAGATFNATAAEAYAPDPIPGGASFNGSTRRELVLANEANLIGVHLIFAAFPRTAGDQKFLTGTGSNVSFQGGNSVRFEPLYTNRPQFGIAPAALGGWGVFEFRLMDNELTFWSNGVRQPSAAFTPANYRARILGRGSWTDKFFFDGVLGRCVSVVCAAGYTATSPEPAVLAARQRLAQRYGITLA